MLCSHLSERSPREMLLRTVVWDSAYSGRLCSFWRVPLHVFNTSSSGSALFSYVFLLVRILSCSRRLFIILRVCLHASFAVGICLIGVFCSAVSILGMRIRTS